MFATNTRTNHSIFIPFDTGSPRDGVMQHISRLGSLARLDFERCTVAGEIIFAVEADAVPVSQPDEEARIGTLAYALRKLEPAEDAAEFLRCLNAICEGGDARCRQTTASHYYHEISERGTSVVLKEMGWLAMQLASLNAVAECLKDDEFWPEAEPKAATGGEQPKESIAAFIAEEIVSLARMTRGRRKSACFLHDEYGDWLGELEANGASVEELDDAFAQVESLQQYDEGGAVIVMSSHERTVACGRLDPEYAAEDLPEHAQYLVPELRRLYASGKSLEELWDDLQCQLEVLFPTSGKTETGKPFYSHANRSWQQFVRQVLEAILNDCQQDFHLTALRTNPSYRQFHKTIRTAQDARMISETMKRAYEARQAGTLPLKHFTALKTAAELQRARLGVQQLSAKAFRLVQEIQSASPARLRYFSWAFYGTNQPAHVIHNLPAQEQARVWATLKTRKEIVTQKVVRQAI
ncbi:MAG: hypothetical protein JST84_11435 [Acidobacteria bacterium]|nr:hypothetical protein [Acidobacteriota bacterium]